MSSSFHHPFRIDQATLDRATSAAGGGNLLNSSQLPDNFRFLEVNPLIFTHTYLLLGVHPQRFVNDLTLYLSTAKTFFERAGAVGGIQIPAVANSDSRRRLSEDLGVALAAFFMVQIFQVGWESISQIPLNSKLSKKRPDFQSYTKTNQRYIFEAKGTTTLSNVEKSMSNAIAQVKGYPENAEAKLAIVSYLSADERFFPSTSFVVDPPSLPEEVIPNSGTSRLLHFEKVLQFAGLQQTAKEFLSMLSRRLREKRRMEEARGSYSVDFLPPPEFFPDQLKMRFSEESEIIKTESRLYHGSEFVGRTLVTGESNIKVFLGVRREAIEAGLRFDPINQSPGTIITDINGGLTSIFSDGTLLHVTGTAGGAQ